MPEPNIHSQLAMGELVPPRSPLSTSRSSSCASSFYQGNYNYTSATDSRSPHNLSYTFINREFMDQPLDVTGNSNPFGLSSFRNLTPTPRASHPKSLPRNSPIDWALFNSQFLLNQKIKQSRFNSYDETFSEKVVNNFENLPFHVIEFIANCVESQHDLISLSQACKLFNRLINRRLYCKIIIVDNIREKSSSFVSDYTLLDLENYPKFLASLHSNEYLIQLIKSIIIETSSNQRSYDQLGTNIYSSLYDLFFTKNNNLRYFENLDVSNLKKFDTLLAYNRDHLKKYRNSQYLNLYSNNSVESTVVGSLDELMRMDLLNLKNFQLLDLNDINKLPYCAEKVSILIENEYNFNDKFQLTQSGWSILSNLVSLQLCTSNTFDLFTEELLKLQEQHKFERLANLRELSFSVIHSVHENRAGVAHSNEISFNKLNKVIDLFKIENLEMKIRCNEPDICNHCILNFLDDWYQTLLKDGSKSCLKKLVIIDPSQSLCSPNINFQWDLIFTTIDFLKAFGSNLKSFIIKLVDFPFLPIFYKVPADYLFQDHGPLTDNMKLPINNDILDIRHTMYNYLLENFSNLEDLVIPDFFYNWLVYNNIKSLKNDDNLNFLDYLNTCHCSLCCEARVLFRNSSNRTVFKDFKKRFDSGLNYKHSATSDQLFDELAGDPDSYRIFYNYLLRELKNFIPFKQSDKIRSCLNLEILSPNKFPKNGLLTPEEFQKIVLLMIHSLRPEISRILKNLPALKRLNLGGIQFMFYRISISMIRVSAIYDNFNEIMSI